MWLVTQKLFIKKVTHGYKLISILLQSTLTHLSLFPQAPLFISCNAAQATISPFHSALWRQARKAKWGLSPACRLCKSCLSLSNLHKKSSQMNQREIRNVNCVISGLLLKKTLSIFQIIPCFLEHYANFCLAETWKNQLWLKISYNTNCSVF